VRENYFIDLPNSTIGGRKRREEEGGGRSDKEMFCRENTEEVCEEQEE